MPQEPVCVNGHRTASCEYPDACECDDGWTTDVTNGQAALSPNPVLPRLPFSSRMHTKRISHSATRRRKILKSSRHSIRTGPFLELVIREMLSPLCAFFCCAAEPSIVPASDGAESTQINIPAVGLICLALLALVVAFLCWRRCCRRRRRRRMKKNRSKRTTSPTSSYV